MNTLIVVLIFSASLYLSAQAFDCAGSNPCNQTGIYIEKYGYRCIPIGTSNVVCSCPGSSGIEFNQPCRVCARSVSINNACQPSPRFVTCLETRDYGGSYVCLCEYPRGTTYTTTASDCDPTILATSTTAMAPPACFNGGNLVGGSCHCPSGYGGTHCAEKYDAQSCERINCKNNGVCAVRTPSGPYEPVCLCRYGTSGEYCELTGTLGSCPASSCLNGAACVEKVVGSTRHAYCNCPAGYKGIKCEEPYFTCQGKTAGKYYDTEMANQGKYFECTTVSASLRVEQKSCSKGLRYNPSYDTCTY